MISVAPAIGPTISGLIVRVAVVALSVLAVLPIALGVLFYGWRNLLNIGETRPGSLDVPSVILSALGFGGFVYGFSSAGEGGGWSSPLVLVPLVVGIVSHGDVRLAADAAHDGAAAGSAGVSLPACSRSAWP